MIWVLNLLYNSIFLIEYGIGFDTGDRKGISKKENVVLDILSLKRVPRDYYKGKNCKPTGFHTRKGGYVIVPEKLPNYVVPDLTDFKNGYSALALMILKHVNGVDNKGLSFIVF
ncbi:conserved hypothetical protein [Ricinus communis]|uniref:Uncharacterized protein n=1 Tax=Ricinus communis TaxID=3988 RepID=B9RJP6_RICCO|nr:conserved hypothetical protein [Ricinus communis]